MSDQDKIGEILAKFIACTGIEDEQSAILKLAASHWDLTDAVNKAIPIVPSHAGGHLSEKITRGQEVDPLKIVELKRSHASIIILEDCPGDEEPTKPSEEETKKPSTSTNLTVHFSNNLL